MSPLDDLAGLRIIESALLTLPAREDWSQVRSPGRARRRRAQGHPQRIRYVRDPNPNALWTAEAIFMHPATAAKFYATVKARDAASPDWTRGPGLADMIPAPAPRPAWRDEVFARVFSRPGPLAYFNVSPA